MFKENELLAKHTTFKVGGPARFYAEVENFPELVQILSFAKKNKLKTFVIGWGSNVLFSDKGFDGLIINLKMSNCLVKENKIIADAGMPLSKFLNVLSEASFEGLEFLAGIPGTIGGAVCMNAGQGSSSVSEFIKKVWVIDPAGKKKILPKSKCKFDYRKSIFLGKNNIILKVEFELKKGDSSKIKEHIKSILRKKMER